VAKIHQWFKPEPGKVSNIRLIPPKIRTSIMHFTKPRGSGAAKFFIDDCEIGSSTHIVVSKQRQPGLSSQAVTITHSFSFFEDPGVEGKDFISKCKKCGYNYDWRDYTKYNQRPKRERRHLERCCVRCHASNQWVRLDLDNQLDKALATMGAL